MQALSLLKDSTTRHPNPKQRTIPLKLRLHFLRQLRQLIPVAQQWLPRFLALAVPSYLGLSPITSPVEVNMTPTRPPRPSPRMLYDRKCPIFVPRCEWKMLANERWKKINALTMHLKGHFFGVWRNSVARGTVFLQFGLTIRHF
jgi:hypothetical protein